MTDQSPARTAEEIIVDVVRQTVRILTRRLLLIVGLLLDFILFVWACITPDVMHLGAAVAFGLMALLYVSFPGLER